MNEQQIAAMRTIFREELSISEEELVDSTAYNELEAWDSLTHLKIVSSIEETFSIELEVDDIIGMENFGKAKEIVGRYLS